MIVSGAITYFAVKCDLCDVRSSPIADGTTTVDDAERYALSLGWRIDEEWHLCPECSVKEPCS